MRVVICQAGVGNVRSVVRAVECALSASQSARTSATVAISSRPEQLQAADALIVPGQGSFGAFAGAIKGGLGQAIAEHIAKGKPYLGICLGMQVLFEDSEEALGLRGLGILPGHVRRLRPGMDTEQGRPLPLPHIGWNAVTRAQAAQATMPLSKHNVLSGEPTHFYFAHTFAVVPTDEALVLATTDYGTSFVSAVVRDNVLGVQFHPEKSQDAGIFLLKTFFSQSI
ncbi:MAG: imidazole glycerol phosphate synthase subunit HisH [Polyangiaceae bacterium]|nr:imidazole glycerol phosphate synthase subunit HisH [Polyangiaceae bacterium]